MTPTGTRARRDAVGYLQATYHLSERRACRLVQAHRPTVRYRRRTRADEPPLRERRRTLAGQRPRWGYRRLHVLLRREAGERGTSPIQRKRAYRRSRLLDRLDGLAIRRRPRKRVAVVPRGVPARPWGRGEAWAMDSMQDVLADGRWPMGGASAP